MNRQNPNEILYKNAILQEENKLLANFPVLLGTNSEGRPEGLLLHCFKSNGQPDYLVIGKFQKDNLPSFNNKLDKLWFEHIQKLVQDKALQTDCNAFVKESQRLMTYPIMNNIEFTQEGYDLLTGKFLYTKDGTIQRTVQLECITEGASLTFGKNYYPVNHQNKVKNIALFAPWHEYHDNYFMNPEDLYNLNDKTSNTYALINNRRLLNYMKRLQPDWVEGHYDKSIEKNPSHIGSYSLQLLDVVTSFQEEEHSRKRK